MFVVSNRRLPKDVFIFEGLSSFVVCNRDFIDMFVISYRFQVTCSLTVQRQGRFTLHDPVFRIRFACNPVAHQDKREGNDILKQANCCCELVLGIHDPFAVDIG